MLVAVAFVTMAVGVNARTAFSLLFPAILDEFGWDRGMTAGAFSFGFLVSALPVGVFQRQLRLADATQAGEGHRRAARQCLVELLQQPFAPGEADIAAIRHTPNRRRGAARKRRHLGLSSLGC